MTPPLPEGAEAGAAGRCPLTSEARRKRAGVQGPGPADDLGRPPALVSSCFARGQTVSREAESEAPQVSLPAAAPRVCTCAYALSHPLTPTL